MENKIYNFIQEIKDIYNINEIGWEYVDELNYYRIWHTKDSLESDKENRKNISRILRKYFSKDEIRNIVFTYGFNVK